MHLERFRIRHCGARSVFVCMMPAHTLEVFQYAAPRIWCEASTSMYPVAFCLMLSIDGGHEMT